MKSAALQVFGLRPPKLNCAQAIVHAYRTITGATRPEIEEFAKMGGGRAPQGACGALYGLCRIAPENAEALTQRFSDRIGASRCREIKRLRCSCDVCVGTAAELLEETLKETTPTEPIRITSPMPDESYPGEQSHGHGSH